MELFSRSDNHEEYKRLSARLREGVLTMIHKAQSIHVGSNLSVVDILAVLYKEILRVNALDPEDAGRDRFIMSKGHAAAALWATLAEFGFFPQEWLNEYYLDDGKLAGHVTKHGIPGVELSTGSLGHGISFGAGVAFSARSGEQRYKTFVLVSDGELNEGLTWEAMLFAAHHKLDNLTVIVDYNSLQSLGKTDDILTLSPLKAKAESFGWSVQEVDGHNCGQLARILSKVPFAQSKPSFIIAHTIKGKGIRFLEGRVDWHHRFLEDAHIQQALAELEVARS